MGMRVCCTDAIFQEPSCADRLGARLSVLAVGATGADKNRGDVKGFGDACLKADGIFKSI